MELATSRWMELMGECLLDEFFRRNAEPRWIPGGLYGMVQEWKVPLGEPEFSVWLAELGAQLPICVEKEATAIALILTQLAWRGKNCQAPSVADGLIQRLSGCAALSHAAAWALKWMGDAVGRNPHSVDLNKQVRVNSLLSPPWLFDMERERERSDGV